MKKISLWAKDHKWSARFIIVASFIVLDIIGFTTGLLLHDSGIYLPVVVMLVFSFFYGAAFIAYPFKRKKGEGRNAVSFYFRQKTCDIILAGSTFFMIVYLGNHKESLFRYSLSFSEAMASNPVLPKDSVAKTYKPISAFYNSMKDENGKLLSWKERKKLLKEQVRAIKKSDEPSEGGKAGLIILSVIVALGLLYLVGALACSLSCGGSDVAAVVVALGGTALVVFLLIRIIRSISGKKPHKDKPAETS